MPQMQECAAVENYGICLRKDSPSAGATVSDTSGPNSPTAAMTLLNVELCNLAETLNPQALPTGLKAQKKKADGRYMGVRVRMPVRDMLRNIRIAKGMDPKELQKKDKKGKQGAKKRAKRLKKLQMKSLEELSIIVEVLEEDLKTSASCRRPDRHLLCAFCQDQGDKYWCEDACMRGLFSELPPAPRDCAITKEAPTESAQVHNFYPDSSHSQATAPFRDPLGGSGSFEVSYCSHRDVSGIICSPIKGEYQVALQQETSYLNPKTDYLCGSSERIDSLPYQCSAQEEWNSMHFFCTQIERDEQVLKTISDQELLPLDERGRTFLHRAVDEGRRALVYVIAKRMVHLKKLDTKDAEGKTPLHLAAQRNQHLMVADLLSLGANINERDRNGKTCLHLSAELGYIRVLEVMKSYMINGTYIDLDVRDVNGLTALQQASVALKNTVQEQERSAGVGQARLHALRKDQMMETLECLLQMECDRQSLVSTHLSDINLDFDKETFYHSFENEVI